MQCGDVVVAARVMCRMATFYLTIVFNSFPSLELRNPDHLHAPKKVGQGVSDGSASAFSAECSEATARERERVRELVRRERPARGAIHIQLQAQKPIPYAF